MDRIRYAWGDSSLGRFLAAVSDAGLVAFEFVDPRGGVPASLRERLAGSEFVEDVDGLAEAVAALAAVVDDPGRDPGIPLDPRGSEFERRVWELLREIPAGETTNYGAIAARLGTRDARETTEAIAANPIAILVPCHRVIRKDGSISGYRGGVWRKRALLARERDAAAARSSARSLL
jgi:AraC family transcriptional regulator, regulatory protein of adaptative response / methylated-DNA-[protein]-cysteine methyltransferase